MDSVQLMLLCLVSVVIGANGYITCEGANITVTCNPGEIAQFGYATFTRISNKGIYSKYSHIPECQHCCKYGDTGYNGIVTEASNPDAYRGNGVYYECRNQNYYFSNLNSYCKNVMINGNNVCNIEVSLSFWNLLTGTTTNDPCPGTYKYLDYDYSCVSR